MAQLLDKLEETVNRSSSGTFAAILVMICGIGLAGVMFVQGSPCQAADGAQCSNDALQRLGLLFGLLGLAAPAVIGALKADQAARQLNGDLDARIQRAVLSAQGERRHYDPETAPTPAPSIHDDPPA